MPKETLPLKIGINGVNNASGKMAINDSEAIVCENVDIVTNGIIKPMGKNILHESGVVVPVSDPSMGVIERGSGLFYFSADRVLNSKKILTDGDASSSISVGDIVGNGSDFTTAASSVGYVYEITSTYIVVSDYKEGSTAWGASQSIYIGLTYTDKLAYDSTEATHGTPAIVDYVPEIGENFLLCARPTPDALDNALINLYGDKAGWHETLDVGNTAPLKAVYTNFDGAIRIVDANFGSTNKPQWYGFIDRLHFSGSGSSVVEQHLGWHQEDQEILAPTRGIYGEFGIVGPIDNTGNDTDLENTVSSSAPWGINLGAEIDDADTNSENYIVRAEISSMVKFDGTITARVTSTELTTNATGTNYTGGIYYIFPSPGLGFNLHLTEDANIGTWDALEYEFGITFIYDDGQESSVYEMAGDGWTPTQSMGVSATLYSYSPYNPRISGARIYYREYNTENDWFLFIDVSMVRGVRVSIDGDYSGWSGTQFSGLYRYVRTITVKEPGNTSYSSLNGYSQDIDEISLAETGMGYKTSVVANRRLYAANIKMRDIDNEVVVKGDLMIKTLPNKPDIFLWEHRVEVEINDGDEIMHLAYFNGKILQFKKNKTYVINVTQPFEYLEKTISLLGVEGSHAVSDTPFGPVFANKYGFYLYDGRDVKNLTTNLRSGKAKFDWANFVAGSTSYLSVGYLPIVEQIMIVNDDKKMLFYDFKTGNIVTGSSAKFTFDYYTSLLLASFETTIWGFLATGGMILAISDGTLVIRPSADREYAHRAFNVVKGVTYNFKFTLDSAELGYAFIGNSSFALDYGFSTKIETVAGTEFSQSFTSTETSTAYIIFESIGTTKLSITSLEIEAMSSGILSNIINDWDGNAIVASNESGMQPAIYKFDSNSKDRSIITIESKNYTFDIPFIRKMIYSMWLSHKNAGSNISIKYRVNNAASWTTISAITDSSIFLNEELDIDEIDILSIQFQIISSSFVDEDFELQDTALTVRKKVVAT